MPEDRASSGAHAPARIEWEVVASLEERNSPGPTLRTAMQRVRRALIRADDLNAVQTRMLDALAVHPLRFAIPRADLRAGEFSRAQPMDIDRTLSTPLLQEAREIASEAVHHLRTALDYLAYQLIWLDSGRPHERSAFLIIGDESDWKKDRRSRLRGLSASHLEEFERLQPFRGCAWTRQLRDLSNVDKHRSVLALEQRIHGDPVDLMLGAGTAHPTDPNLRCIVPEGQRITIQFADGSDALETLVRLAAKVSGTLEAYQGEFGEAIEQRITWDGVELT